MYLFGFRCFYRSSSPLDVYNNLIKPRFQKFSFQPSHRWSTVFYCYKKDNNVLLVTPNQSNRFLKVRCSTKCLISPKFFKNINWRNLMMYFYASYVFLWILRNLACKTILLTDILMQNCYLGVLGWFRPRAHR